MVMREVDPVYRGIGGRGVVAMYGMSWLTYLIFTHVNVGEWGGWVVAIANALVGATVQAPMLIAFALLYFKVTDPQPE